jgi:hypothetical protein
MRSPTVTPSCITAPLLAVVLALALPLLLAVPAAALDRGRPDGDRHPNVGLLAADPDGPGGAPPFFLCSGSVIADDAFLTAAHCIEVFPGASWSVTLASGAPSRPLHDLGFFPQDFPFAMRVPTAPAREVVTHPDFAGGEGGAHDLAVLRFAPGTFDVAPVFLPRPGLLDALTPGLRERRFRLVGYGIDPEGPAAAPRLPVQGFRQTATAPFGALTDLRLVLKRTATGGACLGDSGSPQLLGPVAVSLLSSDGEACDAIVGQRLDTPSEVAFLAAAMQ